MVINDSASIDDCVKVDDISLQRFHRSLEQMKPPAGGHRHQHDLKNSHSFRSVPVTMGSADQKSLMRLIKSANPCGSSGTTTTAASLGKGVSSCIGS